MLGLASYLQPLHLRKSSYWEGLGCVGSDLFGLSLQSHLRNYNGEVIALLVVQLY